MAGKSSKMKSRLSTIRYEMTRDFMSDFASKRVPQFTEEHESKLMEIFGISNEEKLKVERNFDEKT